MLEYNRHNNDSRLFTESQAAPRFFRQRRHIMIILHTDIDYETLKQHRDELVEEARLLHTLQAPKPNRPTLRQRISGAIFMSLSRSGRLLIKWGDWLQARYSPNNQLHILE